MRVQRKLIKRALLVASWSLAIGWLMPLVAGAHCDSVDGPVVTAARLALAKGEATPVLKWVTKDDEEEIRAVFQKTLRVRAKGLEAKELADRYFFETLVRMHRATEGEPYTGLKPTGAIEPIIQAADQALEKGAEEPLVQHLTEQVAKGIRERFKVAETKKKRAEESVATGREFVRAYVEFMHYVEKIHQDASGHASHSQGPKAPADSREHHQ